MRGPGPGLEQEPRQLEECGEGKDEMEPKSGEIQLVGSYVPPQRDAERGGGRVESAREARRQLCPPEAPGVQGEAGGENEDKNKLGEEGVAIPVRFCDTKPCCAARKQRDHFFSGMEKASWWPLIWVVYLLCAIALCLGIGQFAHSECDCTTNVVIRQRADGLDKLVFLCQIFYMQNCDLHDCYEGDAIKLCKEPDFLAIWMEVQYAGDAWAVQLLAGANGAEEVVKFVEGYCRTYDRFMCWLDLWIKYGALPALAVGAVLVTVRVCVRRRK